MAAMRRAGPADLDALLPLVREFCDVDHHPFDLQHVTRALEPLLVDDTHGQVWLIGHDDAASDVEGYGVMTWGYSLESGGREALVDELYVRRRGAGVGAAALNEMLASAAAAGARRVFLETERHNTRVRSFYARLGFQTDDSVWMSRDLTSHDAVVRGAPPEEIELPAAGARLRRHRDTDLDAVHAAIEVSRDHLRPWMPWADQGRAPRRRSSWRCRSPTGTPGGPSVSRFDDADGSVLGGTGLHDRIGPDGLEIGYWRRAGAGGRGLVTQCSAALTRAAFDLRDVVRVEIHCDEANTASAAVPRRLGYVLERIEDKALTAPGERGRSMVWICRPASCGIRSPTSRPDASDRRSVAVVAARAPATSTHEQVTFFHDPASGLQAIVAIASTALGAALGGTRCYPYPSADDALADVLALSAAMAYKNAVAGLDHGGGKAVIIGDPATVKTEALLRAYGRFLQGLGGRYITACDVGTFPEDMDVVALECRHVTGRSVASGGAGDSGGLTAFGVHRGMRAAARHRWGVDDLRGRRVGIAGVGKVGRRLADLLVADGAEVVITDRDLAAVDRVRAAHPGVRVVDDSDELVRTDLDVYAPCALGGALSAEVATRCGRGRVRGRQQPARGRPDRQPAGAARHHLLPGLRGQRRRGDPGRRRVQRVLVEPRRPRRRRSTTPRWPCWRWRPPMASPRPKPPTPRRAPDELGHRPRPHLGPD